MFDDEAVGVGGVCVLPSQPLPEPLFALEDTVIVRVTNSINTDGVVRIMPSELIYDTVEVRINAYPSAGINAPEGSLIGFLFCPVQEISLSLELEDCHYDVSEIGDSPPPWQTTFPYVLRGEYAAIAALANIQDGELTILGFSQKSIALCSDCGVYIDFVVLTPPSSIDDPILHLLDELFGSL